MASRSRVLRASSSLISFTLADRSCIIFPPLFQRIRKINFRQLGIDDKFTNKLEANGIMECTEIQEKALPSALDQKNVLINSQTGSGKTLCYVLPILQKISREKISLKNSGKPNPSAVILAPSIELIYQIGSVCQTYGDTSNNIILAHGDNPLVLKPNTQIIVTMPGFLLNYQLELFKGIKTLVFDEADILFSSQQKQMIHILNYFSNSRVESSLPNKIERRIIKDSRLHKNKPQLPPQFMFVGATMPAGWKISPLYLAKRFVPDLENIQLRTAHRIVATLETEFIECSEEEKLRNLVHVFNAERERLIQVNESHNLDHDSGIVKVLVYVNTTQKAKELYEYLLQNRLCRNVDHVKTDAMKADLKLTVGAFHKEIPIKERLSLLQQFIDGSCHVLVTTEVSSRGLDLPNVSIVLQYDFGPNVTSILHRMGRTARAGVHGKVINFITDKDKDICNAFRSSLDKNEDVSRLFSRKGSFKKNVKAGII